MPRLMEGSFFGEDFRFVDTVPNFQSLEKMSPRLTSNL
jgi:hypothetical protein